MEILDQRELVDEIGRLRKLLAERELELKLIRTGKERELELKLNHTGKNETETSVSRSATASKIVEMSRKMRELRSELHKEKLRAQTAEQRLCELESLKIANEHGTSLKQYSSSKNNQKSAEDSEDLLKKLQLSEARVIEYKGQLDCLKAEHKLTQKLLAQEVGEGVHVTDLIRGAGKGWTGRAEQISKLQLKITELQKHIDHMQNTPTEFGNVPMSAKNPDDLTHKEMMSDNMGKTRVTARRLRDQHTDEQHLSEIKKIESQRKYNAEKTAMEYKNLELRYTELKDKFEASKSRNNILSDQLKVLKDSVKALSEKGRHDDELISALLKKTTGDK